MKTNAPLAAVEEDGVVAVVRLNDLSKAAPLTAALVAGGLRVVEFTFTNPAAAGAITVAREALGERALIGAGSVLDAETARIAILAGASFVVTPTVSLPVISTCQRYGVATVIGALTPTEMLTAWEGGATYVKVFPASLGGPRYLRDVLAPLPQLKLIPTGGVALDNAADFIRAGAAAVALGSNLVDARSVANEDWPTLTARATAIVTEIARARQPRSA
ncbi:MAG: bifunctional 4-hydroxy-2-oxoglutarate aldolase/2-dehydro-3-deoxy-phosphogluconate aldolase [Thermomicrobiales bacterium]